MWFLLFVAVVVMFMLILRLGDRISKLENNLLKFVSQQREKDILPAKHEMQKTHLSHHGEVSAENQKNDLKEFLPASVGHLEPEPLDKLINWIKEDWILKLGAVLLILAFAWLTSYAFVNNWIGAFGRIGLGLLAGAAFLGVGLWRIKKDLAQGGVFLVLGSTIFLITSFAASEVYSLVNPFVSLSIAFLSTALVAFVSVKHSSPALSLCSLILAGCAPALIEFTGFVSLFSYLLVVVLGTLWVVFLTHRRELTAVALIIVAFYSLPFEPSRWSDLSVAGELMFAYVFGAIFFLANVVGILRLKDKNTLSIFLTAFGNGCFLFIWIMNAEQPNLVKFSLGVWAALFLVVALMILKLLNQRKPFYIYGGLAAWFLAVLIGFENSSEAALTIAYAFEAVAISLGTYLLLRDAAVAQKTMIFFLIPVAFSLESFFGWGWSIDPLDFAAMTVMGVTLLTLGSVFYRQLSLAKDDQTRGFSVMAMVFGSLYFYALVWNSLHVLMRYNLATMVCLVLFAIWGLAIYFYALKTGKNLLRLYGGAILGLVVLRLFVVDVWIMSVLGRIVTFLLVGGLFVSTAFLRENKVEK